MVRRPRAPNSNYTQLKVRGLVQPTVAGGTAAVYLLPSLLASWISRLNSVSDVFQMYRVAKLKFRLHRYGTMTVPHTASFYPGNTINSASSTLSTNFENPVMTQLPTVAIAPSAWAKVPRSILMGEMPWYRTQPNAGLADPITIQGTIVVVSTGTEQVYLEVEALYLFKGSADASVTPSPEQVALAQKERLMKLLAFQPSSTTQVGKVS